MCASILVVEDHADYQRNLREILQSEGHTVRTASSVLQAERDFREKPSEMLLLDLRLPDGNGLDLLERDRSERPDLPAIVLTGNADLESALRAIRAGAQAYLRKDAPVEEILATVANVARTSELERKLADAERLGEERRRLAAIGEVVSGVAHEIQNPIQNVVMGIDLIRAKLGTGSPVERYLAQIERASESVRLLVRDLLDYSRSNRMDLEHVDLRTVVQEAIDESRGKAEQAGVSIAWNPTGPATARIDPPRMKQVLLNLLMNAIEALPRGGRVEPRVTATEDGGAEIVVEDDGPGMPAEVVEKAFLPFFTTKARGTGLGLSIVQKIVHAHHGRVTLSSEPGKGTRITIALPPP